MKRIFTVFVLLLLVTGLSAQDEAEKMFREAESRFQSGEYEFALNRYTELINSYPSSSVTPDAQFRKAVALYRLSRAQEAYSLLERVEIRYASTRYLVYVPFWKGIISYELGEYERAVEELDQFLSDPEGGVIQKARLYKALSLKELDRVADAAEIMQTYFETVTEAHSEPYALVFYSSLLIRLEHFSDFLTFAESVDTAKLDLNWRSRFELYKGEAFLNLEQTENAVTAYNVAVEGSPQIAAVAFQRLFYLYRDTDSELERILIRAERTLAGNIDLLRDFWLRIGIISFQRGSSDLARSYLLRIWDLGNLVTMDPLVPLYLADIEAASGRYDRALGYLNQFRAASDKGTELILFRIASLQFEQGAWESSASVFESFMNAWPDSERYAEAGYLRSYALYQSRNYQNSLAQVESLLASTRGAERTVKLLRLKSLLLQRQGEYAKTLNVLEEYIPRAPEDKKAMLDSITMRFQLGMYDRVLEEAARLSASLDPESSEYILSEYLRGLSLVAERQYNDGGKILASLDLDTLTEAGSPMLHPYARYYYAWCFYRTGDYRQAAAVFDQFLLNYPNHELSSQAAYLAGWSEFALGNFSRSENRFARYLQTNPDDEKGRFMYAKSLVNQKKYNQAALVFNALASSGNTRGYGDDSQYEYSKMLRSMDQTQAAAEAYLSLYERFPDSPLAEEAMFARGEVYFSAEQWQKAKDAFYRHRLAFPSGELMGSSLFWGGLAAANAQEGFGAVLLWEKLIEDYKSSPYRAEAMARSAEVYTSRGNYERALELYRMLIDQYPDQAAVSSAQIEADRLQYLILGLDSRIAELMAVIENKQRAQTQGGREAMIELARLYLYAAEGKNGQAKNLLEEVLAKKDQDPYNAARATYYLGEYWFRESQPQRAAETFLEAASVYKQDRDLMAMSLYRAAEMSWLAGNRSDARELVAIIEKNFPDSSWVQEGKQLLEGNR